VEIHHVKAWIDGGLTDIDVLAPACPPHHALIGDGEDQWQTVMITEGPDAGRVAWIAPKVIDPEQIPRVNRAHHPDQTIEAAWEEVMAARQAALKTREEQLQLNKPNPPPEQAQLALPPGKSAGRTVSTPERMHDQIASSEAAPAQHTGPMSETTETDSASTQCDPLKQTDTASYDADEHVNTPQGVPIGSIDPPAGPEDTTDQHD
jgi:hypothetical protein